MERLTKSINGMVWFSSQDTELFLEPCEMSYLDIETAIKKLAAYEDTGFTPEEVARISTTAINVSNTASARQVLCFRINFANIFSMLRMGTLRIKAMAAPNSRGDSVAKSHRKTATTPVRCCRAE